jgi:hypothetical protein
MLVAEALEPLVRRLAGDSIPVRIELWVLAVKADRGRSGVPLRRGDIMLS